MMNICIIVSKKDPAGLNIFSNLIQNYPFEKSTSFYKYKNILLVKIDEESIFCDDIDKKYVADIFIFASKHSSSKGVHSLSIHVPGNWGKAEYGGKDGLLCMAPASYIKEGLKTMNDLAGNSNFEITVEQTHHGPILKKPCFFIEIGSNLTQWQDRGSGKIIADCIMKIISAEPSYKSAVFLGGGHYNHVANKILLNTDYAIGHVCAKHSLAYLDKALLKQAIEKTQEKVNLVILDWKGLGQYKQKTVDILEELSIKYERAKNMLKEKE